MLERKAEASGRKGEEEDGWGTGEGVFIEAGILGDDENSGKMTVLSWPEGLSDGSTTNSIDSYSSLFLILSFLRLLNSTTSDSPDELELSTWSSCEVVPSGLGVASRAAAVVVVIAVVVVFAGIAVGVVVVVVGAGQRMREDGGVCFSRTHDGSGLPSRSALHMQV